MLTNTTLSKEISDRSYLNLFSILRSRIPSKIAMELLFSKFRKFQTFNNSIKFWLYENEMIALAFIWFVSSAFGGSPYNEHF